MPNRRAGGDLAQAARTLSRASDDQLLALTAAGNSRAFEMIVERYRPALLRFCGSLTESERVDDAVQQTFISAWLAIHKGVLVRDLRPWLYRIARNAAIDQHRARGAADGELPTELVGGTDPAHLTAGRTYFEDVLRAVADLPERQRVALLETAVHGRSTDAVADDLGVSGGALRQLVHRARTTVRTTVTSLGAGPVTGWLSQLGSGDGGLRRLATVLGGAGSGTAAALTKTTAAVVSAGSIAAGGIVSTGEHGAARGAHPTASASTAARTQAAGPGNGSGAAATSSPSKSTRAQTIADPSASILRPTSVSLPAATHPAATGTKVTDARGTGRDGSATAGPAHPVRSGTKDALAPQRRTGPGDGPSAGGGTVPGATSPSETDGGGGAWTPPTTASSVDTAADATPPSATPVVGQPVRASIHRGPQGGSGSDAQTTGHRPSTAAGAATQPTATAPTPTTAADVPATSGTSSETPARVASSAAPHRGSGGTAPTTNGAQGSAAATSGTPSTDASRTTSTPPTDA
ncbi:MAG: sigma-70 family RNA polymerase sigma factor [Patulibacter sp.]|nr:sigma-70 family RNA polymerase sigma factor [Patulibacter sp.]